MIEKISFTLAEKILEIADSDYPDTDELEILKYGIECIINMLIPISFFVAYSLFQNIFGEMICWLITFIVFRNTIGGYHARSHSSCIISTILYGILSLFTLQFIDKSTFLLKIITLVIIFTIHRVSAPIIHREEKQNEKYLQKAKYWINILLLLFLHSFYYYILGQYHSVMLFFLVL